MSDGGVQLDANARAAKSVTKSAGISWPYPVDQRLDQLVELANSVGANVRRNELAAAVIASCPSDPEELLQVVLAWRRKLVREVVLDIDQAAQVVTIQRHPPGRRRSTG